MTESKDAPKEEKKDNKSEDIPKDNIVETQKSINIQGKSYNYTTTTGTIVLREEEEEKAPQPKATMFFVAYTLNDVKNPASRPLTFSFNGGPGSSSVWLHMGLLGPQRVIAEKGGQPVPPPYKLIANEHSLLDTTDLVFIDPVSTGYSRAVPGEKDKQFHDFEKDVRSVGEFIRLYTSRYTRWSSPKFLIGESYGTTRAAALSGFLQKDYGLFLNGIMLISSILNFQTAQFQPGNDWPYMLFLPTYTAGAWYHSKLPQDLLDKDLSQVLDEVKVFSETEYNLALMQGDLLQGEEREAMVSKLARFTGLSPDYVRQTNLRINIHKFTKELLRNERKTIGRLDSRFTGLERDATGLTTTYDPSYAVIQGPYTASFNHYVRAELNFESDLPYEILNPKTNQNWKYDTFQNKYVDVAETLRGAMCMNPFLKVFVANGFYDLATPFFATEYTFRHLSLEPEVRKNISMGYYQAGHMMYTNAECLAQLKADLTKFVLESSGLE